jgi:hypothetical protein
MKDKEITKEHLEASYQRGYNQAKQEDLKMLKETLKKVEKLGVVDEQTGIKFIGVDIVKLEFGDLKQTKEKEKNDRIYKTTSNG